MIAWFIKQQEIRLRKYCAPQQQTSVLTAAQVGNGCVRRNGQLQIVQ